MKITPLGKLIQECRLALRMNKKEFGRCIELDAETITYAETNSVTVDYRDQVVLRRLFAKVSLIPAETAEPNETELHDANVMLRDWLAIHKDAAEFRMTKLHKEIQILIALGKRGGNTAPFAEPTQEEMDEAASYLGWYEQGQATESIYAMRRIIAIGKRGPAKKADWQEKANELLKDSGISEGGPIHKGLAELLEKHVHVED